MFLTACFTCCRCKGQSGNQSVHQVRQQVSPHPVAPVRSPPLLLRDDGEGAEEVARRAAGLCQTQQQRYDTKDAQKHRQAHKEECYLRPPLLQLLMWVCEFILSSL